MLLSGKDCGCPSFSRGPPRNQRDWKTSTEVRLSFLYFARPRMRPLPRLTAWATPRASSDAERCLAIDARGVAHAVKRGNSDRAEYSLVASILQAQRAVRCRSLRHAPSIKKSGFRKSRMSEIRNGNSPRTEVRGLSLLSSLTPFEGNGLLELVTNRNLSTCRGRRHSSSVRLLAFRRSGLGW